VSIVGATINEINNRLDLISVYPLSFNFNGLNFSFRPHVFSIRENNMETRVYTGEKSSVRIYDLIYTGKSKPAHVHEALYVIFIESSHV